MLKSTKSFASALAIAVALSGTPALAQGLNEAQITQQNRDQIDDRVSDELAEQVTDKRAQLIEEAVTALDETKAAIAAIQDGKTGQAIAALANATGKLETIVARSPDLALAPVSVTYASHDLIADVDTIRDIGNRVEDLVEDGEFQAARAMLRDFASEIVVATTSLPLATYPDAILRATALLDQGKSGEALIVLDTALSTQVVTEWVIPLAPLRAEALIAVAQDLIDDEETGAAENADGSTSRALTASDYVEAARQELRIAQALGYGAEDDFADIYDALEELDDRIDAAEDTDNILSAIGDHFQTLKSRLFDGSRQN